MIKMLSIAHNEEITNKVKDINDQIDYNQFTNQYEDCKYGK